MKKDNISKQELEQVLDSKLRQILDEKFSIKKVQKLDLTVLKLKLESCIARKNYVISAIKDIPDWAVYDIALHSLELNYTYKVIKLIEKTIEEEKIRIKHN